MKLNFIKYKFLKESDLAVFATNNVSPRRSNDQLLLVAVATLSFLSLLSTALYVMVIGADTSGTPQPVPPLLVCYVWAGTASWRAALAAGGARACSHVLVGFATVDADRAQLSPDVAAALREMRSLAHNETKVLLSVGGAGDSRGFSDMVRNHASRKTFIKSIKSIIRDFSLDGIDLDWEFPAFQGLNFSKMIQSRRERQHFSQLLREIRAEYLREKRDYLLTVALAAQQIIALVAYDIDQINMYVDFANLMTYDFHFYHKYTPFTGFNSPLYARPNETMYMATLNINYTVNWYVSQGLSRNKIVIGIPTYGHTYSLVNPKNHGVESPASGYGSLGNFVDYPALCSYSQNNSDFTIEYDMNAQVPYIYNDKLWVSIELPRSVVEKANFVLKEKLLGAMVYSLNSDDYMGLCGGDFGNNTAFPLIQSIKNTFDSR